MSILYMASLLVIGGVGAVLGAMAIWKNPKYWNVCRFYYAAYMLLLIGTLVYGFVDDMSLVTLLNLVQTYGPMIVGSGGWAIFAQLAHAAYNE